MTAPTQVEFTDTERPHALYRLYDAGDALLYIGITWNPSGRMTGHARKAWWHQVARRTLAWYPNEEEARAAEAIAIDTENPIHNHVRPAVGCTAPPHGQRKGWNKTPLVAWHPRSAELLAWFEAEVERRGGGRGTRSAILEEALTEYRERHENSKREAERQ